MMNVTNENINGLVDYSVSIIDSITKDKKYPMRLKGIMYATFASYLIQYGYEEIENICKVFEKTKFVMTSLSLPEYYKSNYGYMGDLSQGMLEGAPAVTFTAMTMGPPIEAIDEIILSTYFDIEPLYFLEAFIHEVNHLFVSQKNRIYLEKGKLITRTGLQKNVISKTNMEESARAFNEVINSLQSEELVQNLLNLCGLKVNNNNFNNILENIKYGTKKKYTCSGYEGMVQFYRELYNNPQFQSNLVESLSNGEINAIETDFDKRVGEGSYAEMTQKSDDLFKFITTNSPDILTMVAINKIDILTSKYIQSGKTKAF
jgi:hypothetical protein